MKKILLTLSILTIFTACGNDNKNSIKTDEVVIEQTTVVEQIPTNNTVEALEKSVAADVTEETSGKITIPNSEVIDTEEIIETVAN